ncbi:MAG: extracellular solute-binding protein [Chthoniobacterales bacterium]|jgi:putative spermidine/putrescine transport system substrate-binding protein
MSLPPSQSRPAFQQKVGNGITRRQFLARASATAAGVTVLRSSLASAWADTPSLPKSPVTLNIFDVAGNLRLTQQSIEKYRSANPKLVDKIHFTQAPAPELPSKIKAQQNAGRLDIDLVLTGLDGLAAGIEQDLWLRLMPDYQDKFPGLEANYLPPARNMYELSNGYGITVTYYPSGPLLEYAPERVKNPPTSTDELLAWCKGNPGKFMYARPANSGPGRTFLMGLPYLLGDKNPKDPVDGWTKTWSFLKQLNDYIEYYPSGTTATMKEFGEGSRDIIASTTGWDINPRVLGIVPKSAEIAVLKGFHWVTDAHYMAIPKGIAPDKVAVLLDLMAFLLRPEQQAGTYDEGYFYPGPAVKDVPLSIAPENSQRAISEFGRPQYSALIAENPTETPLEAKAMVTAFHRWDEEIGAAKLR